MSYNLLPKNNKTTSEFVNNKETFNNRLFERNTLNSQILNNRTVTPTYMSENYNINRNSAQSIFSRRMIPELSKKPPVDFVNFQDNEVNKVRIKNKKESTNFNQMERETNFFNARNEKPNFNTTNTNHPSSTNPYSDNNKVTNIPPKIDFSKSNLSFFINQDQ